MQHAAMLLLILYRINPYLACSNTTAAHRGHAAVTARTFPPANSLHATPATFKAQGHSGDTLAIPYKP
jgi:hypothetical protein